MRFHLAAVIVFFAISSALAQKKDLISAPSPNIQRCQGTARNFQQTANQNGRLRHYWYWEVEDSIPAPLQIYKNQPSHVMAIDDFSPVSLKWTFTGKRKLVPLIDFTIVQVKPGEPAVRQTSDGNFETAGFDRLWDKATRSLVDMLRY